MFIKRLTNDQNVVQVNLTNFLGLTQQYQFHKSFESRWSVTNAKQHIFKPVKFTSVRKSCLYFVTWVDVNLLFRSSVKNQINPNNVLKVSLIRGNKKLSFFVMSFNFRQSTQNLVNPSFFVPKTTSKNYRQQDSLTTPSTNLFSIKLFISSCFVQRVHLAVCLIGERLVLILCLTKLVPPEIFPLRAKILWFCRRKLLVLLASLVVKPSKSTFKSGMIRRFSPH